MNKIEDKKVEDNLGLVHACCKHFKDKGIDYDDLFSAGCMGLVKAIKNFDDSRGLKLSTYAVPVILGEIKRLFRDDGVVKVGRKLKELAMKAIRLNNAYIKETGRELSINQMAEYLSVEPHKISEALSAVQIPVSLTYGYDEGNGEEIVIPVESEEESISEKMSLQQTINELCEQDRNLIMLRYYENKTQSQTAKLLGITQVQVSRREKKILGQLREKLTV